MKDDVYLGLEHLADLARDGVPVYCVAHARPDADAVATACGTAEALRRIAGDSSAPVYAVFQDSETIPDELQWVAGSDIVASRIDTSRPYVFTACDFSANWGLDRNSRELVDGALEVSAIDHHPLDVNASNPRQRPISDSFGFACINPEAAAASEMVARSVLEARPELMDKNLAQIFINGMSADTLGFSVPSTSPMTLITAAELVDGGASIDYAAQHVWRQKPLQVLKSEAYILNQPSLQTTEDGKIAYAYFTAEDLKPVTTPEGGISANIAGIMSRIEGPEVCFFARELPDGSGIVGSIRSQDGYSARNIAEAVGGGGHEQACGFKVSGGDLGVVTDKLLRASREEVDRVDGVKPTPQAVVNPYAGMIVEQQRQADGMVF